VNRICITFTKRTLFSFGTEHHIKALRTHSLSVYLCLISLSLSHVCFSHTLAVLTLSSRTHAHTHTLSPSISLSLSQHCAIGMPCICVIVSVCVVLVCLRLPVSVCFQSTVRSGSSTHIYHRPNTTSSPSIAIPSLVSGQFG
jgi:hypothetical protein